MHTKQVALKNFAQTIPWQIFYRAGQGVGPVVEDRIKRTACRVKNAGEARGDGICIGIVDQRALKTFAFQARTVFLLAARRKNPPASGAHPVRCIVANAARTASDQNGFLGMSILHEKARR